MKHHKMATEYMVIETFKDNIVQIYDRFRRKGRMIPDGLQYVDSWLSDDGQRCFQLMEAEDFELFEQWTSCWDDLVTFEIVKIGEKPVSL